MKLKIYCGMTMQLLLKRKNQSLLKNKQKAPKMTKPVDQDNEKKPLAYITMERCALPK